MDWVILVWAYPTSSCRRFYLKLVRCILWSPKMFRYWSMLVPYLHQWPSKYNTLFCSRICWRHYNSHSYRHETIISRRLETTRKVGATLRYEFSPQLNLRWSSSVERGTKLLRIHTIYTTSHYNGRFHQTPLSKYRKMIYARTNHAEYVTGKVATTLSFITRTIPTQSTPLRVRAY